MSGRELKPREWRILELLSAEQKIGPATRAEDDFRRHLRTRGLIAYCGKPLRWQITEAGKITLSLRAKQEAAS